MRAPVWLRYAATEVFAPAAAALVVTTFLLLTTQLLRVGEAAFGAGLRAWDFFAILGLIAPRFLVFTLPISVLVGVVGGIGRLAEDRELWAMEALGLSPWRLLPGPLLLGLAGLSATLFLTTLGEPWSLRAASDRMAAVIERNLVEGLTPGVIHEDIPGSAIYARRRTEAGVLEDVLIRYGEEEGAPVTLVARQAWVRPATGYGLEFEVRDGEVFRLESPPTGPVVDRARFARGRARIDIERTVHRRIRFIGRLDVLDQGELGALAAAAADAALRRKARVHYHRRLALPAACLALALAGLPLGMGPAGRRGSRRGLAFVGGVTLVTAYYLVQRGAEAAALAGVLGAPLAAWLPNLVVVAAGLVLLWRRAR